MNRRDFIKALSAMVGSAAITPAFANSLPETIPEDWHIALFYENPESDGIEVSYTEYARVQIPESALREQPITFPECRQYGFFVISHVGVNGMIFPLDKKVVVTRNITPLFAVGALRIAEN